MYKNGIPKNYKFTRKTDDNKALLKKRINKNKIYSDNKKIKMEKAITSISINHNSFV